MLKDLGFPPVKLSARRRVILHHRRLGVPLAVWQDGRVVDSLRTAFRSPSYEEEAASSDDGPPKLREDQDLP